MLSSSLERKITRTSPVHGGEESWLPNFFGYTIGFVRVFEGLPEKTLEETFSQIMTAKFYLPTSEAFIVFNRLANVYTCFLLEIVKLRPN